MAAGRVLRAGSQLLQILVVLPHPGDHAEPAGGLRLLFTVMAVCARVVALWAAVVGPTVPPLRQTVADLARRAVLPRPDRRPRSGHCRTPGRSGFLPVTGAAAGTGAAVSVLAATAALVQPAAGRRLDTGHLSTRTGVLAGLLITMAGLAAAMLPGLIGVLLAAALTGIGTGLITPLGFAALAASTPEERMGQTMGSAELGRELGDAGGPLLVVGVATASTLTADYASLAILLSAGPILILMI